MEMTGDGLWYCFTHIITLHMVYVFLVAMEMLDFSLFLGGFGIIPH
jgi:hypothetical protein